MDLLVTDIVLPLMRGTKLATLLEARYPNLRVLLMSANPEYLGEDTSMTGERRVLSKPFGKDLGQELKALLPVVEPRPAA